MLLQQELVLQESQIWGWFRLAYVAWDAAPLDIPSPKLPVLGVLPSPWFCTSERLALGGCSQHQSES